LRVISVSVWCEIVTPDELEISSVQDEQNWSCGAPYTAAVHDELDDGEWTC